MENDELRLAESHKKYLTVNVASIVDLKAELYKKQAEFKQEKLKAPGANVLRAKSASEKPNIWSKKNAGVLQRAQSDLAAKVEADDALDKSRRALEAKAKLYDKLAESALTNSNDKGVEDGEEEEDEDSLFLVDFGRKAVERVAKHQRGERNEVREVGGAERERAGEESSADHGIEKERERAGDEKLEPFDDRPANPDDAWVDYVDSLGRSRRCLRRDLPRLASIDRQLTGNTRSGGGDGTEGEHDVLPQTLLSDDMRRELQRQKWEKEELAAMNGPIHYSNVQYDEIRDHGAGFYQFSKDELSRQEELQKLEALRQQTVDSRARREKLKQQRKAMLQSRLEKVRQRKKLRGGNAEAGTEVSASGSDEDNDVAGPKMSESAEANARVSAPVAVAPDVPAAIREWDRGKPGLSEKPSWKDKQRAERPKEFAPPSFYQKGATMTSGWMGRKNALGPSNQAQRRSAEPEWRQSSPESKSAAPPNAVADEQRTDDGTVQQQPTMADDGTVQQQPTMADQIAQTEAVGSDRQGEQLQWQPASSDEAWWKRAYDMQPLPGIVTGAPWPAAAFPGSNPWVQAGPGAPWPSQPAPMNWYSAGAAAPPSSLSFDPTVPPPGFFGIPPHQPAVAMPPPQRGDHQLPIHMSVEARLRSMRNAMQ